MALSSASITTSCNTSTSATTSCTAASRLNINRRLYSSSTAPHRFNISFTPRLRSKCSTTVVCAAPPAVQHEYPQLIQAAPATDADLTNAVPASPTSYLSADPFAYWNSHKEGLLLHDSAPASDAVQEDTPLLTAELQLLANAASDRAEMHAILAQQRDNWNKLFQHTLTSTSLTACVLSGLATCGQNAGLSLPALLLNAGTAAMMAVINQFQPSQLAEEQRTSARLFRKLASDIYYALSVSPHLRQSLPLLFDDCKRRLRALDKAFPMPLTPGGLEKFPTTVVPPVLIEPKLMGDHHHKDSHVVNYSKQYINGWDRQLTNDLKHIATILHNSDTPKYTGWAQNLVKVNKCLAIAAPCFAASAALLNAIVMSTSSLPANFNLGMWAASFSVLATFVGSFSNDMQLGMVFELYRNSAGYYADVETSIEEALHMPVEQRENGKLFRQRIAYQLGRWPTSQAEPVVPTDAKEAGTLF